jgi:2-polyprenyl-3-methyl-5-hydroxy-6-metoxy-1,4-benzoquinol methylase
MPKQAIKPSVRGRRVRWGPFEGEMESVGCKICGRQDEGDIIYRGSIFSVYCCYRCHLMYSSPRYTEESLLAICENEGFSDLNIYRDWTYERWRQQGSRSYHTEKAKVATLKEYVPEGSRVLDVGCASGLFVLEARRQGFLAEGVEPSKMLSDIARNVVGVPVTHSEVEQFPPPYRFDAVVIWDVLEHLYDPVRVARCASDLLKAGGILMAQTPHYLGLSHRLKTLFCRLGLRRNHFKHFGFPHHVYSFDRRSLTALLVQAGLKPLRFESWPRQMKDGQNDLLSSVIISANRRWCLSDYLMCIARREG